MEEQDRSNGYEAVAERFMSARSPHIGVATVREWSRTLARSASILELGCGHGVPVSELLISEGFDLHGIDASGTLIAAFRHRFPHVQAECEAVEDSRFFSRTFDGIVACGLIFLLPADVQSVVIRKAARALNRNGTFLFTSPREPDTWPDALTGRESISLGSQAYEKVLRAEGLTLASTQFDEGGNHYYLAAK